MRKLDFSKEDPIDYALANIADKLCPIFKSIHFTPNGITTLSLIFGLLSVYYLYNYKIIPFAICYFMNYFFDVMDGYYARKYSMVSKNGDLYDHAKDVIVNLLLVFVIFKRYRLSRQETIIAITLVVLLLIFMNMYLGCQEIVYDKSESDTLNVTRKLCLGKPHNTLKIVRFFGTGFFNIFVICLVIYIYLNNKKSF